MPKRLALKGQRFGRLFVLFEDEVNEQKKLTWRCICDCGKECTVEGRHLTTQHTRSCGCLARENREQYRRRLGGQFSNAIQGRQERAERERLYRQERFFDYSAAQI